MKRYTDWRDLPDDPNRVGDEDYKPTPPKEVDEDEAYERGKEREWQEKNRRPNEWVDIVRGTWKEENWPRK